MRNIIRFYNQNRKSIWMFLIIIFFLFLILKLVDTFVATRPKEEAFQQVDTQENLNDRQSNVIISSNKSGVSGEGVSNKNLKTAQEMIERFLTNCNEQKYEEAYGLLTDECKEEMYPSLDVFVNSYASKIFNGQKINCNIQNWTGDIYKVEIAGDILATGKVNEDTLQDYITIDNDKLNINRYIKRTEINRSNEKDNIKIEVLNKNTYMDYETYTIKIDNNSQSDILLDTKRDMKSMYIEDDKGVKYSSYNHELTEADLTITRNHSRTITIKYYSSYNSSKDIQRLVFSNIVMNYDSTTKIINNTQIEEIGVNM